MAAIAQDHWYEVVRFADGISLIHEPWIKPFFRCNMWHVSGRDFDLLVDTGLGHFPLRANVPLLRSGKPLVCVASHAHFDHIGSHHEFEERWIHAAEADILADPRPEWTLAAGYADESMFIVPPEGWSTKAYLVKPAPATKLLADGDTIDLGDRKFTVIHTPGHSPGGIALYEEATGALIAGDIVYDGELVTDTFHSDLQDYRGSLQRLAHLPVSIVHGGHFASFGRTRLRQIIEAF
jgi:glyoxylase-like metal-dependent hydrolase (beta-lactamase superfamily II)